MDLITTHINADFDALGSLVAAKKLYPDSRLLLPGSQEEAVRDFLSLAGELITVESERECKVDDVDRLILVDTRHGQRIGIAAGLVDKGVEIHIYDHHPRMKGDIVADKDVYEAVGATVTILADIIKKRKIRLSYLEATVMLLGIYEETGSLTYRATTKLDVDMVSFLLSQGASLSVVSSYLDRELSQEALPVLTELINSTERVTIKGVSVSTVEIAREKYVGEMGSLVQKLMDIENISVLFVFIRSRDRVDIIGRSAVPSLDVNKVLAHFGGGGHPGAASAKVRGTGDVEAVRDRLMKILKANIKVAAFAEDIMSKGIRAFGVNKRVDAARMILIKKKMDGMPVVEKNKLVGIITLTGLNKAIKRGFGHSRIKGYMARDVKVVKARTPIHLIQKMVLDTDVGVLPVMKGKKIAGVINRTDILKSVHRGLFLRPARVDKMVTKNLSKKMTGLLPKEIMGLVRRIGRKADSAGYRAFIVGGLVRDLILGVKNLDLDIVVEGDAIKLGEALSKELGAALVVHRRFGTCSVITRDRIKIDLATARKEVYERPAALPTVEFSSLKDDLIRRDFTINAMAVSINKESFGQLIDFFNGERDLTRGIIKVMHDASFIDDPTRIFRAVRFEQRFGFSIDGHTGDLIKHAIKREMFKRVEPQRIRDEIILILKEEKPYKAISRMAELDELRFLHHKIKFDRRAVKLYGAIDGVSGWYEALNFKRRAVECWLVYLMALFDRLSYNDVSSICSRFVFRRSETIRLLSSKGSADRVARALDRAAPLAPSRIYRLLEPLSFEVILFILAKARSLRVKTRVEDFFRKYNGARISIKGGQIKAMGLKPGPHFGSILEKVLYAKLDGKVRTRKEELMYAAKLVKSVGRKG